MARYNKIFAGPFTEATPQTVESVAAVDVTAGMGLVMSAGAFALAGAASVGKLLVAQDNYLTGGGVGDVIKAGDTVIGLEVMPHQFLNVLVATGTNLAKGDGVTPAAGGLFGKAGVSDMVIGFADEAYNNTTGVSQLVRIRGTNGYMTPAA